MGRALPKQASSSVRALDLWLLDPDGGTVATPVRLGTARDVNATEIRLSDVFSANCLRVAGTAVVEATADQGPPAGHTWIVCLSRNGRMLETIGAGSIAAFNEPDRIGNASFLLDAFSIDVSDDRRPVHLIQNVSSDPDYAATSEYTPQVIDRHGDTLDGRPFVLKPFGSIVLDYREWFGPDLEAFLKPSGGLGSARVVSRGQMAIAFHLILDPKADTILGDHTRPIRHYIAGGYGVATGSGGLRGYLRACREVLPFVRQARRSRPGRV